MRAVNGPKQPTYVVGAGKIHIKYGDSSILMDTTAGMLKVKKTQREIEVRR